MQPVAEVVAEPSGQVAWRDWAGSAATKGPDGPQTPPVADQALDPAENGRKTPLRLRGVPVPAAQEQCRCTPPPGSARRHVGAASPRSHTGERTGSTSSPRRRCTSTTAVPIQRLLRGLRRVSPVRLSCHRRGPRPAPKCMLRTCSSSANQRRALDPLSATTSSTSRPSGCTASTCFDACVSVSGSVAIALRCAAPSPQLGSRPRAPPCAVLRRSACQLVRSVAATLASVAPDVRVSFLTASRTVRSVVDFARRLRQVQAQNRPQTQRIRHPPRRFATTRPRRTR